MDCIVGYSNEPQYHELQDGLSPVVRNAMSQNVGLHRDVATGDVFQGEMPFSDPVVRGSNHLAKHIECQFVQRMHSSCTY